MSDAQIILRDLDSFPLPSQDPDSFIPLETFRKWGEIALHYKKLTPKMTQEERISIAVRLSGILSVLITELGCAEEHPPLSEEVALIKTGRRFDYLRSDTETVMVYFAHKAIEMLSAAYADAAAKHSAQ